MTYKVEKKTFTELKFDESKLGLWDIKFNEIPVWHFLREDYTVSTNPVPQKLRFPGVVSLIMSIFFIIKYIVLSKKDLIFILDRQDLRDFVKIKPDANVLLHSESHKQKYNNVSILNVFRFVLRKTCWIFFLKRRARIVNKFIDLGVEKINVKRAVNNLIGDYAYNKSLSLFIGNSRCVYYSGCGPAGIEKYMNAMNSFEIQHGVIHRNHPGYSSVPYVKNGLIVYSKIYKDLLRSLNYGAKIESYNFKTSMVEKKDATIKFDVVIYTQPISFYCEFIDEILTKSKYRNNILIKRHPRDEYDYIHSAVYVDEVHPSEVRLGVFYTTTVIEDYLGCKRNVVIYMNNKTDYDVESYFDVYQSMTSNKLEERLFNTVNRFDELLDIEFGNND
ncbi:hypothetical protein [Aliivibrio fischeri]|uniref:hypothetical protein n=1 Tax=Aliivibrio fischeri TaxID=668 RepID=UPI0007C5DAB7|nr:hypothetical protein [Aliivibrio fischeri]